MPRPTCAGWKSGLRPVRRDQSRLGGLVLCQPGGHGGGQATAERPGGESLKGKIAVANATVAYARFGELFGGERWERLAALGARVQRPLWASTSTKNPLYPDTLYVDSLIGPHTVNTVPPETLEAFMDHGRVSDALEAGLDEARADLRRLEELGIDLEAVTQKLQDDGVKSFADAFDALLDSIAAKRDQLLADQGYLSASLGGYQPAVDARWKRWRRKM